MRSGTAAGVRAVRLQRSGGRQDRHLARRLVRRLHFASCCAWSGWGSTTTAIWTWKARTRPRPSGREFMKQALEYREYRDTKPFEAPDGIVTIEIDPESGMPATPVCPKTASRSLHRRHGAGGRLPAARRPRPGDQRGRMGYCRRRAPAGSAVRLRRIWRFSDGRAAARHRWRGVRRGRHRPIRRWRASPRRNRPSRPRNRGEEGATPPDLWCV